MSDGSEVMKTSVIHRRCDAPVLGPCQLTRIISWQNIHIDYCTISCRDIVDLAVRQVGVRKHVVEGEEVGGMSLLTFDSSHSDGTEGARRAWWQGAKQQLWQSTLVDLR